MDVDPVLRRLFQYFCSSPVPFPSIPDSLVLPSVIENVYVALTTFQSRTLLDTAKPVLEAGCGDARVAALFAYLGFRVLAIDFDPTLIDAARSNIEALVADGIIPKDSVTLHCGDYMDREAYDLLGFPMIHFGTVYYYNDSGACLEKTVNMIQDSFSPQTIFLNLWGDLDLCFPQIDIFPMWPLYGLDAPPTSDLSASFRDAPKGTYQNENDVFEAGLSLVAYVKE
jgi:SAM-dependent methyltransferase